MILDKAISYCLIFTELITVLTSGREVATATSKKPAKLVLRPVFAAMASMQITIAYPQCRRCYKNRYQHGKRKGVQISRLHGGLFYLRCLKLAITFAAGCRMYCWGPTGNFYSFHPGTEANPEPLLTEPHRKGLYRTKKAASFSGKRLFVAADPSRQ